MAKARILIVEDECIIAIDLQNSLESLGYDVPAVAASGEEAIRLAAEFQPDLMLMDIVLEGKMDGVEAMERIHDTSDIPVIYLTAYADDKTRRRAEATRPIGYICKPFDERVLMTTIEFALQERRTKSKSTSEEGPS
jgi:two-component system, response regulator PdtaR